VVFSKQGKACSVKRVARGSVCGAGEGGATDSFISPADEQKRKDIVPLRLRFQGVYKTSGGPVREIRKTAKRQGVGSLDINGKKKTKPDTTNKSML